MNAFCLHDYDGLVGQKGFQAGPYVHLPKEEFIMEDCIFCKIAAGEIPSTKVYEDDNWFAFKDIEPCAPVHILVIPKKHVDNILAFDEEYNKNFSDFFLVVKKIAEEAGLKENGFRLVMNTGEKAGQSVFHFHAHIIGGKEMGWPPFPEK